MRVALLFLLFFAHTNLSAQSSLRIINANTRSVTIKDNHHWIRNMWALSPQLKPDTYRTAVSDDTTHLTFYTDLDSVQCILAPGDEYNFAVILNSKDTCFTRISTLRGTKVIRLEQTWLLQHPFAMAIILSALVLLLIVFRKRFSTRFLLMAGPATAILFWLSTVAGGWIHGRYNHIFNIVSELGAAGTRSAIFMAVTELLMALLTVLFICGLCRMAKLHHLSVLPIVPVITVPVAIGGIAFYTLDHPLHATMGTIMLAVFLSPLLALILWRRSGFKMIRSAALISIVCMLLILTKLIPGFEDQRAGLIQRFFHAGWTVWFLLLGIGMIRINKSAMK